MISTAVPPWPNKITGLKRTSSATPASNSSAPGRLTISCTMKPSTRACGLLARMRDSIASAATRTASGQARFKATPPTSLLCVISGEGILITTGFPIAAAMTAASSASCATRVVTKGMP